MPSTQVEEVMYTIDKKEVYPFDRVELNNFLLAKREKDRA